jgi:hypothetical protein
VKARIASWRLCAFALKCLSIRVIRVIRGSFPWVALLPRLLSRFGLKRSRGAANLRLSSSHLHYTPDSPKAKLFPAQTAGLNLLCRASGSKSAHSPDPELLARLAPLKRRACLLPPLHTLVEGRVGERRLLPGLYAGVHSLPRRSCQDAPPILQHSNTPLPSLT